MKEGMCVRERVCECVYVREGACVREGMRVREREGEGYCLSVTTNNRNCPSVLQCCRTVLWRKRVYGC